MTKCKGDASPTYTRSMLLWDVFWSIVFSPLGVYYIRKQLDSHCYDCRYGRPMFGGPCPICGQLYPGQHYANYGYAWFFNCVLWWGLIITISVKTYYLLLSVGGIQ